MDVEAQNKSYVSPFLKWAGGKRWLAKAGIQVAPTTFNTYFEPFLGGGAIFFSLMPRESILADSNSELIDTYRAIKTDWKRVEEYLRAHQRNHNDAYYYKMRSTKLRLANTRAARFLYLNRTCWNGLYRVNLNGEFNVPRGTKNTVILSTDNFAETSKALENSQVLCQDFEATLELACEGDFVFIDPPYTVKHNLNGFIKYNEKIFSWDDQVRLKQAIARAVRKGVMVTMSNADHESIHTLYADICDQEQIERTSLIAGGSKHRKKTSEVLMRMGWSG